MVKEAIVIAGGLGTRLRSVVKDVPKPMAKINGKPFLEYLLKYLSKYNINKVILAVGYKYEIIKNHFGENFKGISIIYSVEENSLGTGGAIRLALEKVDNHNVIVLNGDTYFDLDLIELNDFHNSKNADISIALKKLYDFDRYGKIEINSQNRIINFLEKEKKSEGLINGGIYLINKDVLLNSEINKKFSFETDFLEKRFNTLDIYGKLFDSYFIDIGIPDDLNKAKKEYHKLL